MTEEIIIAGFGGQGVLSMGKIMAYSAVMQDMEVSWMPSYGPEMRGGTANVTVIISDERISSPIIRNFDTAIILNQQSLDKLFPFIGGGVRQKSSGFIGCRRHTVQVKRHAPQEFLIRALCGNQTGHRLHVPINHGANRIVSQCIACLGVANNNQHVQDDHN